MGAFGATISLAFAVGPLAVLELRAGPGDDAVSLLIAAAASIAGAALAARAYSNVSGSSSTSMSRIRKPRTSAPPPASETIT